MCVALYCLWRFLLKPRWSKMKEGTRPYRNQNDSADVLIPRAEGTDGPDGVSRDIALASIGID
jgi:hypothetical protein